MQRYRSKKELKSNIEDPRERIVGCMDSKMTRDYFQVRMSYKPIECIIGNSYSRLKEPHPFRLTDETIKSMVNGGKNM